MDNKNIAIGVGSAVVIAGLIGGGIALHKKISYDNRAIVEKSCVMNGFGEGHCNFTNLGKTSGSLCGFIKVSHVDGQVANGEQFCSGEVAPKSTVKVEWSVPAVNTMCDAEYPKKWSDLCSFSFY